MLVLSFVMLFSALDRSADHDHHEGLHRHCRTRAGVDGEHRHQQATGGACQGSADGKAQCCETLHIDALQRGRIGPFNLDDALTYYTLVAVAGFAVLYFLLRVTRSPFGRVLLAIRENSLRATFQGYPIERYKLAAFVLSAMVTGLAGSLIGFQTYLVSAEAVSVPFSGELLAMVVIGGMHHILGPALGSLFFILFRELFSIWTANWLFWFGAIFVGFVLFSPRGLIGIWDQVRRRLRPPPEESAAMSRRKIYEGLPLPESYGLGSTRHGCAFCVLASAHDIAVAARAAGNRGVYLHLVDREASSSFSFQSDRWLGDVAPDLLPASLAADLARGQALGAERLRLEASLPQNLRYVNGWPQRVPSLDEAAVMAQPFALTARDRRGGRAARHPRRG